VGDVRVVADVVAGGHALAELGDVHVHPGREDGAGQPGGLGVLEVAEEVLHVVLVEALRGQPHREIGVEAAEACRLLLEEGKHEARRRVAGVAARHEDGVNPREGADHAGPLLEREFDGLGIAVVLIEGRVPDPDIDPVLVRHLGNPRHHLDLRPREVRAVGIVVRAGRKNLHRVGTEDDHIAHVAFPLRQVPAGIGIGLGPVGHLMTP
jgi:hypothetical protein